MTPRQEIHCLAALLGVWFTVNLATLGRSPTVWPDEVMFTDPAVHWVQGDGLTSSAWPQPLDTPAVLNGPLYTLLLSGWLKAWSVAGVAIGPSVVRSLNGVLTAVAAIWLWGLAWRRGVLASPGLRLGGVAAFLCANGVTAAYRGGRYDLVGLLVVLAGVVSVGRDGLHPKPLRSAFAAAWVPFAGLYLVPYCLLLALGAVLCGGRQWLRRVLPALLGIAAGGVALVGMHLWLGTFPYFIAFTRQQSLTPVSAKLAAIAANIVCDFSVAPFLGFLAVCLAVCLGQRGARWPFRGRRMPLLLLGLLAGIAVPVGMTMAGKYARHYGWMAFVPVLAVVLCVMERGTGASSGDPAGDGRGAGGLPGGAVRPAGRGFCTRWSFWLGVAALTAAIVLGLPLRTLVCVLEWQERDYGRVSAFVRAQVRTDDRVVVGYSAYYPATQIAGAWYLPDTLAYVQPEDRDAITCIVDRPESAQRALARLGGEWQMTAEYRAEPQGGRARLGRALLYHLAAYRRVPRTSAAPGG